MSTNALIGTLDTRTGQYRAAYVHGSAYPTEFGPQIAQFIAQEGGPHTTVATLLDYGSWSFLSPGWAPTATVHPSAAAARADQSWDGTVPGWGLAHNDDATDPLEGTVNLAPDAAAPIDADWAYLFDQTWDTLHVFDREGEHVAALPVHLLADMDQRAWQDVECGREFERCSHYATAHFTDVPAESARLSTRQWIGMEPLGPEDVSIVIWTGATLLNTSGRFYEDGLYRRTGTDWRSTEFIMVATPSGRTPASVTLVYPPTAADVAAREAAVLAAAAAVGGR